MFSHIRSGNAFPQPLTAKEEACYFERYSNGDLSARNTLIERNLRLVAYTAKKYQNLTNEAEDLISVGTIGLIKAVTTFNAAKGNRLATYASRCIDNEILMYLRAIKKYSGDISLQEPMGTDLEGNEISLEDKLADEDCNIEDQAATKLQIVELYEKIGNTLFGREREIIGKRYGLGNQHEKRQSELAKELGISRSYV